MNESSLGSFIELFHAAPVRCALAVTGGGSGAIAALLRVPGGSATILEAVVPYSSAALAQYLGARPEHFCSARTARAMAMAAFWRCRALAAAADAEALPDSSRCVGLGVTASLASKRPKRGAHRLYVATQSAEETAVLELELTKNARSRAAEEDVVTQVTLQALARAARVSGEIPLELLAGEVVKSTVTAALPAWRQLLLGELAAIPAVGGGNSSVPPRVLFSGAFDPLHEGHRAMAQAAAHLLQAPVAFEISIENVDKPPLDYQEMKQRAAQFAPAERLWFTRAPTFVRKAQLFPGLTFVVGADTLDRIAQPRYYGGDERACAAALAEIAERGCRFLVFGRKSNGAFETLEQLQLPATLRQLCTGVPESTFRNDISSTLLRRQR